jgi:hypothetical protein
VPKEVAAAVRKMVKQLERQARQAGVDASRQARAAAARQARQARVDAQVASVMDRVIKTVERDALAAWKQQTRVSAATTARPDSRVRPPPQQAKPVAAVGEEEAEVEGMMQSDEEPSQSQSEADDDTLSWLIEMLPPDLSFQDFSKQLRGFSEQVGGRGGCGCALCCAADVDVRCRRDCD